MMAIRLGINGFGRIGRLVYRIATEQGIEVVAINDLVPADNLAYLLKHDTMHGMFKLRGEPVTMTATEESFSVNGKTTKTMAEKDPAKLPWGDLGVDYVLESTGLFTDFEKASLHRESANGGGCKRVMISAPTKSEPAQVPTLVYKVNDSVYDPSKHTVVSNASCTTNCLAPVAKVIHEEFGLEEGLMTTIHAVTATQPTQDGPSKKDWRGGRNAYMNIIPASTGAAKAVALAIPALKGKLTGMSFRVPTATVSCVDLTFRTAKVTSLEAINAAMLKHSQGPMNGVLGYTNDEVVSSDFVSDRRSSIYDAGAGIQLNDRFFKVVSWYDNEAGYAARCVDMFRMMGEKDRVK
jgi:glyceraldehyde 3-phosphate dehydrogenase